MRGKLVRDRIPDIIREDTGKEPKVTRLSDPGKMRKALLEKLVEEANEARGALTRKELIEELADIGEVMLAIRNLHRISLKEVEWVRHTKQRERGGFSKSLILYPGTKTGGS